MVKEVLRAQSESGPERAPAEADAQLQQEEYLACAFYGCDQGYVESLCDPKAREKESLYLLEDCFDDSLLSTDTPFVFDHDFEPPSFTSVFLTGGTGASPSM